MIIGVPKEIKDNEFRVALTPAGVKALKEKGHRIIVEKSAGAGSAISDDEYSKEGAEIVSTPKEVFQKADLIVKVKEPLKQEFAFFKEKQIIFTFFHLATKKDLVDELLKKKITAIAYETVETEDKRLPLLRPMSEVAGKLSVQIGAEYLQKPKGGRGVLLGGVPGVERGSVVIIGAGSVGINAAMVALGLGAETTIIDASLDKLVCVDALFGGSVKTLASNAYNIENAVKGADLLVGAVHIPGARTPLLVSRQLVAKMKKGSVIVDVAVDQGGCVETIHPTTHSSPVYDVDGVIHYGVTNMPGAVPRTSTYALTNATLPYVVKLAGLGLKKAVKDDISILNGINVHNGKVCNKNLAQALDLRFSPLKNSL